ncbi:hypothetical protein [Microbispora sp. NBC_01389]|uniref:hypothetical protein n=1 Tax=Microbispora sp. NBC_01389 TaxID=2903584 RepID=UPI00324ACCD9
MEGRATLLRTLLERRHQETHRAFCAEYDKTAREIDTRLIGSSPSREAFGRWMKGHLKTKPRADHCRVLERMFPGHTVAELLAPYDAGGCDAGRDRLRAGPGVSERRPDTPEAATNRRDLLHLGAAGLTGGLIDHALRGPDLFEEILDLRSIGEVRLDFLEGEAERLGRRVPPAEVLPEALMHLSSVRELLAQRQPAKIQQRLARVGAKLSIVIGEILFCADHFVLARRWYSAASRAAEEAGDRYIADLALASATLIPTYSAQPRAVLAMVSPRLEQAGAATPAVAWLWGLAALAHASLGERAAFERAMSRSREILGRCELDALQPGILSFQHDRREFYEVRGRADLGDLRGAEVVVRHVNDVYRADSNDSALVQFAYASALAEAGEAEEACRLALKALRQTPGRPGITVVVRAHEFNALLNAPATVSGEWRDALAAVRSPAATGLWASSV